MRKAIEGREYSKFIFTKVLSDTLEEIATYGEKFELKREECSNLNFPWVGIMWHPERNKNLHHYDKNLILELFS